MNSIFIERFVNYIFIILKVLKCVGMYSEKESHNFFAQGNIKLVTAEFLKLNAPN